MDGRVWGYARVSTPMQKTDRQVENIRSQYPTAVIIAEEYSGATLDRPEWKKLEKRLRRGDTVVFDEVSRMSRNAAEGVALYERLFHAGVSLVFLKEPHINSSVYRERLERQYAKHSGTGNSATDKLLDAIMVALQEYAIDLAREQIALAFRAAEQEIAHLRQRTREGVRRAQLNGKTVGRPAGASVETKKAREAKKLIRKHCRDFGGSLSDAECMKLAGIARNSYYKYKRDLRMKHEEGTA